MLIQTEMSPGIFAIYSVILKIAIRKKTFLEIMKVLIQECYILWKVAQIVSMAAKT